MRALLRPLAPHAAVIASCATYVIGFPLLYGLSGGMAGSLVILPVLTMAWSFKVRAVIAMSALAAVIFPLEYLAVGDVANGTAQTALVLTPVLALIGWLLCYAREDHRQVLRLMATDPVTGLLNRGAFLRVLEAKLPVAHPAGSDLVVIDVIHFRQATASFGNDMNDELLRAIGNRLRDNAEGDDRVARTGSDEFRMWLRSVGTPLHAAESVLAMITAPFRVSGTEVLLDARVAVARYPDHANGVFELVSRVEIALDDAKSKGKTTMVATARSEKEHLSSLDTFTGLRSAIGNGELRLHYQPIVELPSANVSGVEALIRWQHPERGLLAPREFIAVAEQSGLIVPLTGWVLNEALRQSRAWSDEGRPMRISINVGTKALARSVSLPATLGSLLRSYGVDPELIALEVTETDIMANAEHAIECLRELKALGVRIEVDDFGTGYSSLAYLQKLPLDAVKIDRSFITPLFTDPSTSAIVRAAIELSHALGLETIAEGVEDQAVVEMLGAMGCDFAQGYVFARPLTADALVTWMASRSRNGAPAPVRPPVLAVVPSVVSRGTVLVVDDEHPFRISAHRILTAQGYSVLHAATASEALRLCASHRGEIDIVLTDLFLTDWQGHKLAAHLRNMYPELRVMFMSGDPAGSQFAGTDTFLAKPFSRQQLVASVALALAS